MNRKAFYDSEDGDCGSEPQSAVYRLSQQQQEQFMGAVPQMGQLDLTDLAAFKAWAKQYPSHLKVLKEIAFRRRGSSARIPGDPTPWAAYLHKQWREWTDLKESTLERRLRDLVDAGLIERKRRCFGGSIVHAWLRPTPMALEHLSGMSKSTAKKPSKAKAGDGMPDGTVDGLLDGTPDGTITYPPTGSNQSISPAIQGEGGKAGEDDREQTLKDYAQKIAVKKFKAMHNEIAEKYGSDMEFDPSDPDIASGIQQEAKKLRNLFDVYPPMIGPHATSKKPIVHPAEHNPKWSSWSPEIQWKVYSNYEAMVAGFYKKYGGGPPTVLKAEKPKLPPPNFDYPDPFIPGVTKPTGDGSILFGYVDPNAPKKKPSGGGVVKMPKQYGKPSGSGIVKTAKMWGKSSGHG